MKSSGNLDRLRLTCSFKRGGDPVDVRQVRVQHDLLATHEVDAPFDEFNRHDW
jgi:hypothetical protein